jgi:hypothetical protein
VSSAGPELSSHHILTQNRETPQVPVYFALLVFGALYSLVITVDALRLRCVLRSVAGPRIVLRAVEKQRTILSTTDSPLRLFDLLLRNIIQIDGILVFNLGMVVYAALQVIQTREALYGSRPAYARGDPTDCSGFLYLVRPACRKMQLLECLLTCRWTDAAVM